MNKKVCSAILIFDGESYHCELEPGHEKPWMGRHGLAHQSTVVDAFWAGPVEEDET